MSPASSSNSRPADGPSGSLPIHVLVVDDEQDVREMVQEYLSRHGYTVSAADGGAAMREVLSRRPVHVVILDLRMPGEDGLTLARWLREAGDIGVIMLTASAEPVDRIVGLEIGADDYISKPFDPRELLARVRSLVRRMHGGQTGEVAQGRLGREIKVGRHVLNLDARALYDANGAEVPITSMDFDLLEAFVQRPNRVLSREQLLMLVDGPDAEAFDRSIDVRVLRLRKKIEVNPDRPTVLRTVRGAGYIFDAGG